MDEKVHVPEEPGESGAELATAVQNDRLDGGSDEQLQVSGTDSFPGSAVAGPVLRERGGVCGHQPTASGGHHLHVHRLQGQRNLPHPHPHFLPKNWSFQSLHCPDQAAGGPNSPDPPL